MQSHVWLERWSTLKKPNPQAEHTQAVFDFFEKCRREDPEAYAEICERYPVISRRRLIRIKQREHTVGLLGLQASNIPNELAHVYDAVVDNGEEE